MEDRTQQGFTREQNVSNQGFWQTLLRSVSNRSVAPRNMSFQEVTGLSLDSAIQLRKVQGALRENWSGVVKRPMVTHQGASKKWSSATRHIQELPSALPISHAKEDTLSHFMKPNRSQAPIPHEEIRGLDDIFTAPVTGLFLDEPTTPPAQHQQTIFPHAQDANQPVKRLDAPLMGFKHVTEVVADTLSQAAFFSPKQISTPDLAPPPVTSFPEKAEPIVTSRGKTEFEERWRQQDKAPQVSVQRQVLSEKDSQKAPSEAELISVFKATVAKVLTAHQPPSGVAKPIEAVTSSRQPVAAAARQIAPRFSAEEENVAPDWVGMTEGAIEPGCLSPYLRPEQSSDILMSGERPTPAPARPIYRPSDSLANTRLPIRDQLQLDKELKEDLSSLDYISRNNRIVSDSLTSLVDRYFQQAALEDDSSYY